MLVDFMIIGAAKCGTTSLAYEVALHPQINFCKIKEPHYFSREKDWKRNISLYHDLFIEEDGKIYGEASPYYTLYPEYEGTAERIFEYNPKVKLIYIIRNPIDRIYSNYKFQYAFNQLKRPLSEMEYEILENPLYINRSKYYMQLEQYLKFFPKSQIHVCVFEEFVTNKVNVLNSIYDFLKINRLAEKDIHLAPIHFNDTAKIKNLTKLGDKIARWPIIYNLPKPLKHIFRPYFTVKMNEFGTFSDKFRNALWEILYDDVQKLQTLTNINLVEIWGKKNA